MKPRRCGVLAVCFAIAATSGISSARPQERGASDAARSQVLSSVEDAYATAQTAARAGDLKRAIVALERVLILNPNLPNIRLELGLLYLRAGAPELARYHLEAALAAPAIPPAARARAQEALAQASAASARGVLTGVASVGARYESNANAGPDGRNVVLFGLPAILDQTSRAAADLSFTGSLAATYAYGLGGQRGHLIEADLDLFGSFYADRTDLDFALAALQIGPRFFVGPPTASAVSVRPFASVSYQTLGGDELLKTYGGGVNARATLAERVFTAATISYARQDFNDTARRVVSDRTGDAVTGLIDVNYLASPRWLLRAGLLARHDDADAPYQTYDRFGGSVGATYAFPAGNLPGPISIAALASYSRSDYDAPDPTIDPATARADDRWEASVNFAAPMTDRLSLVMSAAYVDNGSTLAIFDYTNTVARMEVQLRF